MKSQYDNWLDEYDNFKEKFIRHNLNKFEHSTNDDIIILRFFLAYKNDSLGFLNNKSVTFLDTSSTKGIVEDSKDRLVMKSDHLSTKKGCLNPYYDNGCFQFICGKKKDDDGNIILCPECKKSTKEVINSPQTKPDRTVVSSSENRVTTLGVRDDATKQDKTGHIHSQNKELMDKDYGNRYVTRRINGKPVSLGLDALDKSSEQGDKHGEL